MGSLAANQARFVRLTSRAEFEAAMQAARILVQSTDWLGSPQRFRFAGAEFSKKWPERKYTLPLVPREQFDGLIFIEKTTRARSLP